MPPSPLAPPLCRRMVVLVPVQTSHFQCNSLGGAVRVVTVKSSPVQRSSCVFCFAAVFVNIVVESYSATRR